MKTSRSGSTGASRKKRAKPRGPVLAAFDKLILELTKRKRRWTDAERRLYNDCIRSIATSVLVKEAA